MAADDYREWALPNDRVGYYIESAPLCWEQSIEPPIKLEEQELLKAQRLKFDLSKVLQVKRLLEAGKTPTTIYQQTGIARNSVYKYQRMIYTKKYRENSSKDSQSTPKQQSVLSMLLLTSSLFGESTLVQILVCFFCSLVLLFYYLEWLQECYRQAKAAHREETRTLSGLVYRVVNLSYRKEPIIVGSQQERIYYSNALRHYKNSGRAVIVIVREPTESAHAYYYRKRRAEKAYIYAHPHLIEDGLEAASEYWQKLEYEGLLDCFSYPIGKDYVKSLEYLQEITQWLRDHPRPTHKSIKQPIKFVTTQLETLNNGQE